MVTLVFCYVDIQSVERVVGGMLFYLTDGSHVEFGCSRCDAMHLLVALGSLGIMLAAMYPRNTQKTENMIEFLVGGALNPTRLSWIPLFSHVY